MNFKSWVKKGIKLFIEADGSVTIILMRIGRKHLIAAVDRIIPDE